MAVNFTFQNFAFQMVVNMFGYMYGVLNVDKIKKPIAQFSCKLRDESFESNCDMI